MAKKKATCPFEKGSFGIFKGYGVGEDGNPVEGELDAGEVVKVLEVTDDGEGNFELSVESLLTGEVDAAFYPEEIEEEADDDAVAAAQEDAGEEADEADEADEAEGEDEGDEADAETEQEDEEEEAPAPAKKTTRKTTAKKATTSKAKLPAKSKAAAKKTPAKKTAAKKKEEAEPIEIIDTEAVEEIMEEAGDALEAASSLAQRVQSDFYTLGGVLLHIERDGLHRDKGYTDGKNGFNDYVSDELGVEYRKARYYMAMYQKFTQLGIEEEIIVSVGWTKARELVSLPDKASVEAAFEFAQDNTRDDLIEYVKEQMVDADKSAGRKTTTTTTGSKAKAKKTAFKFSALEENAEMVKDALDKAGEMCGEEDISAQFIFIITEWAQTHGNLDVSLEQATEALQSRYGVKVEVTAEEEQAPPKKKTTTRRTTAKKAPAKKTSTRRKAA